MKKSVCLIGMAVVLAASLAGCGTESAKSNGKADLYLTLNAMDDFRQTLVDVASEKAGETGATLTVESAEDSIEVQVQGIKAATEKGCDVILCGAVSADTIVEIKATAGDTPIVFFNNCPDKKHLSKGKYVYVGSDEAVAGQYQAEYVLDKFASKEEINVVLIKGPKNHSATDGRTKGVKQVFKESGKKVNYVFEDYANWDTELAKELFTLFLKTGSPVDCVICNNDGMALGIVEACKEAGIDLSNLPVLGVDATAAGCEAIKNGEMAFTVYQSGLGQGQKAIETAAAFASGSDGQEIEGITEDGLYVWVPFEKVDSSNVAQYVAQ